MIVHNYYNKVKLYRANLPQTISWQKLESPHFLAKHGSKNTMTKY